MSFDFHGAAEAVRDVGLSAVVTGAVGLSAATAPIGEAVSAGTYSTGNDVHDSALQVNSAIYDAVEEGVAGLDDAEVAEAVPEAESAEHADPPEGFDVADSAWGAFSEGTDGTGQAEASGGW